MKVRNLKANHNYLASDVLPFMAVLARMKVRNLKANHNIFGALVPLMQLC